LLQHTEWAKTSHRELRQSREISAKRWPKTIKFATTLSTAFLDISVENCTTFSKILENVAAGVVSNLTVLTNLYEFLVHPVH